MRKEMKLASMDDLEKEAEKQGVSWEDFKQTQRNQIITQKVIGEEVGQHLSVSKEDEQAFYDAHKSEMEQPEAIRLSEILVAPKSTVPASDPTAPPSAQPPADPAAEAAALAAAEAKAAEDARRAAEAKAAEDARRGAGAAASRIAVDQTRRLTAAAFTVVRTNLHGLTPARLAADISRATQFATNANALAARST